jgi:pentatricopeptide repeat protein
LALSSKKTYAEKALEIFQKMKMMGVKPDTYTYVGVLRAKAKLGDVTTANNVIKEMKILNFEFTEHVYTGLLSTYAGACRIDYVKNEHVEKYVQDSWEIFKLYCKTSKPNINILNSLLEVLAEAHEIDQIDGKLLPIFNKNNISMNVKTYELLMKVFWDKRQGDLVLNLYAKLKNKGLVPNIRILNTLIECSIKRKDANGILEALQTARSIEREINHKYLVMLGKLKEVPDRLYVELKNWPRYGQLNKKIRSFKKPTFSNRRLKKAGYLKSKGRRYRKS